ncbi:major facilitator superfamily domain-containing protein [Chytridium lagenaria]|nr:major facilitator superfamily domain-containing protein [Chytridium lagenaria]
MPSLHHNNHQKKNSLGIAVPPPPSFPPVAMLMFGLGLLVIPSQNLFLSIACRQFGIDYDSETAACRASTEANALAVQWSNNVTLAGAIPSLLSVLFTGVLMDKIGRKPFIILSSIGSLFFVLTIILIFFGAPIALAYAATFLLGGIGPGGVILATFAYISDTSDSASRAGIFAVTESILILSALSAPFISGLLSSFFGSLLIPTIISITLIITCIFWVIFLVPESLPKKAAAPTTVSTSSETSSPTDVPKEEKLSFQQILTDLGASFSMLSDGPLLVITIFTFVNGFILAGTSSYFILYLSFKFGWGEAEQGTYLLFYAVKRMVVLSFILPALTKYFESSKFGGGKRTVQERTVFELRLLLAALVFYGFGFSVIPSLTRGWQLYLVLMIESYASVISPISRSMLSKAIPEKAQGGLMSTLGFLGSISDKLGSLSLSYLYQLTLATMPGVTLYLCAVFAALNFILLQFVNCDTLAARFEAMEVDNKADGAEEVVTEDSPLMKNAAGSVPAEA